MPVAEAVPARRVIYSSKKGDQNLSEPQDNELDRLDTGVGSPSQLATGCQAVIKGDVVVEFPLYTRNYVQRVAPFNSASPTLIAKTRRLGCDREVDRFRGYRHCPFREVPAVDPLTVRFTDLRERVMQLDGFSDDPKASNEPKLEAIQMAWYEEWKEGQ
jgi:FeS assembly protein IscX